MLTEETFGIPSM